MDFIAKPFGILMQLIYETIAFQNYGLAIIYFSVFVRILLFPLNLKQQKSLLKTQELQPELEELKKMYGNDKDKFQQEQMKLYQKYNINPMAGCLPLLIQLPLLLTLYQIVTKPLTFISGVSASAITSLQKFVATALDISKSSQVTEIKINNYFMTHGDKLAEVKDLINADNIINMKFLKIFDLGLAPAIQKIFTEPAIYIPLLLIPIVSSLTTYLSQKLSAPAKKEDKNKKQNESKLTDMANPLNTMTKIMPIITLLFTFSVPAGVGLYWIIGNILGIGQNYVTKRFFQKKKEGNE